MNVIARFTESRIQVGAGLTASSVAVADAYVSFNGGSTVGKLKLYEYLQTLNEVTKVRSEFIGLALIPEGQLALTPVAAPEVAPSSTPLQLNPAQLEFVRSKVTTCRVMGNPGCGKTRSIIEYCLDKYARGVIANSKDFMIATFSRMAAADFLSKGKASRNPKLFTDKNICTIHKWAMNIFKKLPGGSRGGQSVEVNTVILATLNALNHSTMDKDRLVTLAPELAAVKFIVIDEAQDLNRRQYDFMIKLGQILESPCIMVGDPNQSIYQFQNSSDEHLINHVGPTFPLTVNYRSTKQITKLLNHIRPHEELPSIEWGSGREGLKPIVFNGTPSEIDDYIVEAVRTSGYAYEDIAIIGPVKRSGTNSRAIGLSRILEKFSQQQIGFTKFYADGSNTDNVNNSRIVKDHVNLMTCHGSKGLEFKLTIVINYNVRSMGAWPSKSEYENFKRLWYVGLSRSIDQLIICSNARSPIFAELASVPESLYTRKGREIKIDPFVSLERSDLIERAVTKIVYDNKIMTDSALLKFSKMGLYRTSKQQIAAYQQPLPTLLECDSYAMLYGLYAERLFMMYYYQQNHSLEQFAQWMSKRAQKIVILPESDRRLYTTLKHLDIMDAYSHVSESAHESWKDPAINKLLQKCRKQVGSKDFFLYIDNPAIHYNCAELQAMCADLPNSANPEAHLFDIILYLYQLDHETKYMLAYDFDHHLTAFAPYYRYIKEAAAQYHHLEFECKIEDKRLQLNGVIDCFDMATHQVIELKFASSIKLQHQLQALIYYNALDRAWMRRTNSIAIVNLKSGTVQTLSIEPTAQPKTFIAFMSHTLKRAVLRE